MKNLMNADGCGVAADITENAIPFHKKDIATKTSVRSNILSQKMLMDVLHYDPDSGIFIWKISTRNHKAKPGKIAGHLKKHGYITIKIRRTDYYAHRLAWLYVHGEFPPPGKCIDHINHDSADNRIANLRVVTPSQNAHNARLSKNNTSGHLGVCWRRKSAKWEAQIRVNNIRLYLGRFSHIDDAVQARKAADLKYGFHVNHGGIV